MCVEKVASTAHVIAATAFDAESHVVIGAARKPLGDLRPLVPELGLGRSDDALLG